MLLTSVKLQLKLNWPIFLEFDSILLEILVNKGIVNLNSEFYLTLTFNFLQEKIAPCQTLDNKL